MATPDQTPQLKSYLRRKFYTGGTGVTYSGIHYAATSAGINLFSDAIFSESAQSVIVIQTGFEGGYSTGQMLADKRVLQGIIEELIEEFGFSGVDLTRHAMMFGAWNQFTANT
jgi:hypothetical protein